MRRVARLPLPLAGRVAAKRTGGVAGDARDALLVSTSNKKGGLQVEVTPPVSGFARSTLPARGRANP
jgi:hypothetical protein